MTRRTATSTTAAVLLAALLAVALLLPVPYVTMRPGPTRNVLAMAAGDGDAKVVSIEGRRTYPTDGSLRMTTVSVTSPDDSIGIGEAVRAWLSPDEAVLPRSSVYPDTQTAEEAQEESALQMVASQEVAVAAALRLLGEEVPESAEVRAVTPGGPADGVLEVGDLIVAVDGEAPRTADAATAAIRDRSIGDDVELTVSRDGSEETVTLTTVESPPDDNGDTYPLVGITPGIYYDLPIDVEINLPKNIVGPSAGTIFALAIYDSLTPGPLLQDASVAGTGVIDGDGQVGPIGGIQQKIVGAFEAKASTFLVPGGNCAEALGADVEDGAIRLVRIDDLAGAVDALQALAEDPDAEVPGCE